MKKLLLILAALALGGWLVQKPAGTVAGSCTAGLTSSATGADLIQSSATVVNNLTCQ